jgi:hypothetical protein
MAFVAGKGARVLLGAFDLSAYLKNAGVTLTKDTLETTTFTDSARDYIEGLKSGTATLSGLFDGADDTQDEQVQAAFGSPSVTNALVALGGLTIGVPGYAGRVWDSQYEQGASFDGLVTFGASLAVDGGLERAISLHALAAETGTANYASVDNTASSANGGAGYIFVTAQSGTAGVVKIQHSTDNMTWVDLITFSSLSGTSSTRTAVTGTVNRYVRAALTTASTSITFQVSFARF